MQRASRTADFGEVPVQDECLDSSVTRGTIHSTGGDVGQHNDEIDRECLRPHAGGPRAPSGRGSHLMKQHVFRESRWDRALADVKTVRAEVVEELEKMGVPIPSDY